MDIKTFLDELKTKNPSLSNVKIAKEIGVHRNMLSAWIDRKLSPSLENALKIHELSKGLVTYKEMLSISQLKGNKNKKSFSKNKDKSKTDCK